MQSVDPCQLVSVTGHGDSGEKVQRSTSTCCLLPGTPRLSGDVRSKEENDFLKKIKFKAIKLYLNQLNFIKLN